MAQTKPKAAQFYGVSGNGTAGQVLISDGNGGMSWGANTEQFTVSWSTPTGQSLTYTEPNPQSSQGLAGSAFPATTFTVTPPSGKEISGTATIAGLPTGITATQSLSGTGADNILTVTLAGVFPGADSLNTALTISGLTVVLPLTVEYLVIAGGGGGGKNRGGGGGAGGLLTNYAGTALNLAIATPYPVTVGAGGNPTPYNNTPTLGSNSVFSTIISYGGGGGGAGTTQGANGGSGGGAPNSGTKLPGSGISGQGFAGGNATSNSSSSCGGGGGAGGVGANAGSGAGGGGVGLQNAITVASGTGPYYAGGGGGGASTGSTAPGGNGGGGAGCSNNLSCYATSGTANTGGGGGGNGGGGGGSGGYGGSGIVILRYPSFYTVSGLTGNTDTTTVTGTSITTFITGTGNIQFNLI